MTPETTNIYQTIKTILQTARNNAYKQVNFIMVEAYWTKGFSQQSIGNMQQFYKSFPILSTLWRELSWSHYKLIVRLKDERSRAWNLVSKYQLYLPRIEELKAEIEKDIFELELNKGKNE